MMVNVPQPVHRRVTALRAIVLGLVLMLVALIGLVVGLQRQATISVNDRAAIREVIAARKSERDAQAARVQLQLDGQARVLCAVVMDFRDRAQSPESRASLDRAVTQLDCARVLRIPPKGNQ